MRGRPGRPGSCGIHPGEGGPVTVAILRDASERAHAEQERRTLDAAERLLARTLDYEATLQAVVRLATPALADLATVYVVEADGTIRWLASAGEEVARG